MCLEMKACLCAGARNALLSEMWHDGTWIPMTMPEDTPDLVRRLGRVPLSQGLAADALERIRSQAHSKATRAGEFFFRDDDGPFRVERIIPLAHVKEANEA
jgi:hypothetical protein